MYAKEDITVLLEFGVMVLYFSGFLLIKKYCKPLNIRFLWCG